MNPSKPFEDRLLEAGVLSRLDVRFARLMRRLSGTGDFPFFLAAALVSRAVSRGDVCLDLHEAAGQTLVEAKEGFPAVACPEAGLWIQSLKESPVVGSGEAMTPLVLDPAGRFYLHRLWEDETLLAGAILERARAPLMDIPPSRLKEALKQLFPRKDGTFDVSQAAAACIAATRRLCVVSGGPGTGKTTLAARILSLLLMLDQVRQSRIHLAAPTGKAAARLKTAIRLAKKTLPVGDALRAMIPEEATTLHRLLGSIPGRPHVRFGEKKPLPTDLVMVDEASMIDLPLMAKLFRALPETARIVLLGDKDQLASVESGHVLGDICEGHSPGSYSGQVAHALEALLELPKGTFGIRKGKEKGLADCLISLEKNYRFQETSGIRQLSRAVKRGDADGVMAVLRSQAHGDIQWVGGDRSALLKEVLENAVLEGFGPCLQTRLPDDALEKMERFRILCALNRGPFGVETLNAFVQRRLQRRGLMPPGAIRQGPGYAGMPILITRNHYETRLFNGDTGLLWFDREKGLHAIFPGVDAGRREVPLSRLPEHEVAYAMTVHKSQGSEFDEVLLVLPDRPLPVLTRELLYTGITRARKRVFLLGGEDVIRHTVTQKIQRRSGLKEALWGF